jgi:hypothetical protein
MSELAKILSKKDRLKGDTRFGETTMTRGLNTPVNPYPNQIDPEDIQGHLEALHIADEQGTGRDTLNQIWGDLRQKLGGVPELQDLVSQFPEEYDDTAKMISTKGLSMVNSHLGVVAQNDPLASAMQEVAASDAPQPPTPIKQTPKQAAKMAEIEAKKNEPGFEVPADFRPMWNAVQEGSSAAASAYYELQLANKAFKEINEEGFFGTGPLDTPMQKIASTIGQTLGSKSSEKILANFQILNNASMNMIGLVKKNYGPQISNSDVAMMVQSLPNENLTPSAFPVVSKKLEFLGKLAMQKANFYNAYGNKYKNIAGAEAAWNNFIADLPVYDEDGNINNLDFTQYKQYIDNPDYHSPYANKVFYTPDGKPVKGTYMEYEAKKAGLSVEEAVKKYGFTVDGEN